MIQLYPVYEIYMYKFFMLSPNGPKINFLKRSFFLLKFSKVFPNNTGKKKLLNDLDI